MNSDQQESPPGKSPLWLMLRVLDEPSAVFTELAARPKALLPVIVYIVLALVPAFGTPASVLRSATEHQFQQIEQRRPNMITPEMRQRGLERATSVVNRVTIFVFTAAIGLLTLVIVAAVLRMIFSGLSPEPITFKQEFAIAAHAFVPQMLGLVATLVAIIAVGDAQFRFSLGLLFNPDSGGFVYKLANQFGLFGAWNIYLLALGNQVRIRAKGIATPLAVVGGLWVAVNLVLAGVQSVMGGLMG